MEASMRAATWDPDQWRAHGACRTEDVDLFFPVGVTGGAEAQMDQAKAVCRTCPVRAACLEFALRTNQEYGVWGGATEEERKGLRRARRSAARRRAS